VRWPWVKRSRLEALNERYNRIHADHLELRLQRASDQAKLIDAASFEGVIAALSAIDRAIEEQGWRRLGAIQVDPETYHALLCGVRGHHDFYGVHTHTMHDSGYARLTLLGVNIKPHYTIPGAVVFIPEEKQ
jgi:hypothetical protein